MLRIECEKDYRHFSDRLYSIEFPLKTCDFIHLKANLVGGELTVSLDSIPAEPNRKREAFLVALGSKLGASPIRYIDMTEGLPLRKSDATVADFDRLHERVEEMENFHLVRFDDGEEWSRQVLDIISVGRAAALDEQEL